jgi:predicted secreted protein
MMTRKGPQYTPERDAATEAATITYAEKHATATAEYIKACAAVYPEDAKGDVLPPGEVIWRGWAFSGFVKTEFDSASYEKIKAAFVAAYDAAI